MSVSEKAHRVEALPLRVLYVQHVGLLGGSSRSLFELISNFPKSAVDAYLVAPRGQLTTLVSSFGVSVEICRGISQFDNCDYSYYRGFRWLILLRELLLLAPTCISLIKARKKWGQFDIVHVNDVTMPFAVWLSRRIFPESRVVVHARAVQRKKETLRKAWLAKFLSKNVDAIIAINSTVHKSLPEKLPVKVIHNGFSVRSWVPDGKSREKRQFTVGMVGVLARSKGCLDFIKAADVCRQRGFKVHFSLVGGTLQSEIRWFDRILGVFRLKDDVSYEAFNLITDLKLHEIVKVRPFCEDLQDVYRSIDVVCFPSFLDAPGRPIFEAGFFGVPSIVSISQPRPDTFLPEEIGLIARPGDPESLADAIQRLHDNPHERERMGLAAREFARHSFDAKANSLKVVTLYKSLLSCK